MILFTGKQDIRVKTIFGDNTVFDIFEYAAVMKHPCEDAHQGMRNLGLELQRGSKVRDVHMSIIFIEVTYEETGFLIINCGLDQE